MPNPNHRLNQEKRFFLQKISGVSFYEILRNGRNGYSKDRIGKHIEQFIKHYTDNGFVTNKTEGKVNEEPKEENINGFELTKSKDSIFRQGLFNFNEKKHYISLKGFRALLYYIICVDSKKELLKHENPNFSLQNINELISCFALENMSSDTFHESRIFIEFISEDSKFGFCTLKKDEINNTWYIAEKSATPEEDKVLNYEGTKGALNEDYKELYHKQDYLKTYSAIDKLYSSVQLWIQKVFKRFITETYTPLVQIGDKHAVEQKVAYYIPLNYRIAGKENQNNYQTDEEVQANLLKHLWDTSIIRTEAKYRVVFSDAGQGKTSLLAKMYLKYRKEQIKYIDKFFIGYFNIDEELEEKIEAYLATHDQIEKFQGKQLSKILFLDGLDEDRAANENIVQRVRDIARFTKSCDSIIITCRTHFFDDKESSETIIREHFGSLQTCEIIYLQKFNPKQINRYLKKRYSFNSTKRKIARKFITDYSDKKDFISQALLLNYIDVFVRETYEEEDKKYNKSELYERIIRESQVIEAKKHTNVSAEIENHVNLIFDAGQAIAKIIYKKRISSSSKQNYLVSRITTEELAASLKNDSKEILTIKRRSVIVRDTVGNWLFIHKSFQEFFIGYAAFKDAEFDCVFEYPKGFNPLRKKEQASAAFFYVDMMLFKIRKIAISQLSSFSINQKGIFQKMKSFQVIQYNDIINTNLLERTTDNQDIFEFESTSLIEVIRCFKNLEQEVNLSLQNIKFHTYMLGNMPLLESITLANSNDIIKFEDFLKFDRLKKIELIDSTVANIFSLSNLPNLSILNIHKGIILDENIRLKSNSIKELLLSASIKSLEFLKDCPNITNLAIKGYIGDSFVILSHLHKLESISMILRNNSDIELFIQLCQNSKISIADITLLNIDNDTFNLLEIIHDKIKLIINFYGITLYHEGVKRLYREKVLEIFYLNDKFSFDSIRKLRSINEDIISDVKYTWYKREFSVKDWRTNWDLNLDNKYENFTPISIQDIGKYQFNYITILWFDIKDFALFNEFKNLKKIVINYAPNIEQLEAVFNNKVDRKSLTIINDKTNHIDLTNFQELYFDELAFFKQQKILNIQALTTCEVNSLEFNNVSFLSLEPLLNLKKLKQFHLHHSHSIHYIFEFLWSITRHTKNLHIQSGNLIPSSIDVSGVTLCFTNCGITSRDIKNFNVCGKKRFNQTDFLVEGAIRQLLLKSNGITNTQPFVFIRTNISSFGVVTLNNNPIKELNGFIDYSLNLLSVESCKITSIPTFSNNASIIQLSISNNPLKDISHIGTINDLSNLDLKGCWDIENLMPLKSIKSLKTIGISVYVEKLNSLVTALKENDNLESIELEVKGKYTAEHDEILEPIMSKIFYILKR